MALRVKEDMLSVGVTPNTVTWSSLISACANAGLVEQAIQLFEEMLLAGCEPNSQCCNILLHACVEACQYDRAFRLFQCWNGSSFPETSGKNDIGSADGIKDARPTYKNCITSMPNCKSNSRYSSFAKKIPFTPTTTTYNILMKACGTDYLRAKALIDEMKTVGLSPSHISWSILIDLCGGSGNVEGAIQVQYACLYLSVVMIYNQFVKSFRTWTYSMDLKESVLKIILMRMVDINYDKDSFP